MPGHGKSLSQAQKTCRLTWMDSIVISVFAIVILSILGGLFLSGSQALMGADEDPKDGTKVATTVFGAVAVYGVCPHLALRI